MADFPFDTPCRLHSSPLTYTDRDKAYLTVSSTGQIINTPLDVYSGLQKWKIVKRGDQYFDIVNIATDALLGAERPSGQEREYTSNIYGNSETGWDIERTAEDRSVVIKAPCDFKSIALKVLDLSYHRIVFWQENRGQNQRWIWDTIDTIPPARVRWEVVVGGSFPSSAVQGGNDIDDDPLYVTRAVIPMAGEFHCGKGGPHLAKYQYCLIPWGETERSCALFEVLVADPESVIWIACKGWRVDLSYIRNSDGNIMKPIEAGRAVGNPLYVIRANVDGYTTPGKGNSQKLWIGFKGKERTITGEFEILCYSSDSSD